LLRRTDAAGRTAPDEDGSRANKRARDPAALTPDLLPPRGLDVSVGRFMVEAEQQ